MRINTNLLKGLDERGKELVTNQANYSKEFIRAVRKELQERIEASYIDEEELSSEMIEKIKYTIGYRKGIREVLKLIPEV